MIFGFVEKAYVINLASRPEKLVNMQRRLDRLCVPFTHFLAIQSETAGTFRTPGHRGCTLSHLAIVQEAQRLGLKNVLILEDDAMFRDNMLAVMAKVREQLAVTDWDICFLGAGIQAGYIERVADNLLAVGSAHLTHAYILNAPAFQRFIDLALQTLETGENNTVDKSITGSGAFRLFHALPILAVQEFGRSDTCYHFADRVNQYAESFRPDLGLLSFVEECEEEVERRSKAPLTVALWTNNPTSTLSAVLDCLEVQSVRPRIFLWNNGPALQSVRLDWQVISDRGTGSAARWFMAAQAETEYVCIMNEDIGFTDHRLIEDALSEAQDYPDKIIGPYGARVPSLSYARAAHFHGANVDVPVDIIKGRFMLLRRKLLQEAYFPLKEFAQDDDIAFSAALARGRPLHHVVSRVFFKRVAQVDSRAAPDVVADDRRDKAVAYFFGKR